MVNNFKLKICKYIFIHISFIYNTYRSHFGSRLKVSSLHLPTFLLSCAIVLQAMTSRSGKHTKPGGSGDAPTHFPDDGIEKKQEANADAAFIEDAIRARFKFDFSAGDDMYANYKTVQPPLSGRTAKVEIKEPGPWGKGGHYVDFIYGTEVMPNWQGVFSSKDWKTFYDLYNLPDRAAELKKMQEAGGEDFVAFEQYTIMYNFRLEWNAQLAEKKRQVDATRALAQPARILYAGGGSSMGRLCPRFGVNCTYGKACMHRPPSPCPQHGNNCHFGKKCKFREGNMGRSQSNTGQRYQPQNPEYEGRDRNLNIRPSSASGMRRS